MTTINLINGKILNVEETDETLLERMESLECQKTGFILVRKVFYSENGTKHVPNERTSRALYLNVKQIISFI